MTDCTIQTVFLGATEIDSDFNKRTTPTVLMAPGGHHRDTAAGAKMHSGYLPLIRVAKWTRDKSSNRNTIQVLR